MSYSLAIYGWLPILPSERVSIISPSGYDVCFSVSFTNNCLQDNVGLAQAKGISDHFKHSKGSRSETCKQSLWMAALAPSQNGSIYVNFSHCQTSELKRKLGTYEYVYLKRLLIAYIKFSKHLLQTIVPEAMGILLW